MHYTLYEALMDAQSREYTATNETEKQEARKSIEQIEKAIAFLSSKQTKNNAEIKRAYLNK